MLLVPLKMSSVHRQNPILKPFLSQCLCLCPSPTLRVYLQSCSFLNVSMLEEGPSQWEQKASSDYNKQGSVLSAFPEECTNWVAKQPPNPQIPAFLSDSNYASLRSANLQSDRHQMVTPACSSSRSANSHLASHQPASIRFLNKNCPLCSIDSLAITCSLFPVSSLTKTCSWFPANITVDSYLWFPGGSPADNCSHFPIGGLTNPWLMACCLAQLQL